MKFYTPLDLDFRNKLCFGFSQCMWGRLKGGGWWGLAVVSAYKMDMSAVIFQGCEDFFLVRKKHIVFCEDFKVGKLVVIFHFESFLHPVCLSVKDRLWNKSCQLFVLTCVTLPISFCFLISFCCMNPNFTLIVIGLLVRNLYPL